MGKTIGIILIVIGAVMLIWTGFSFTREEKVLEVGGLELNAKKQENVNWPPYVGGVILIVGLGLVLMGRSKPA